MALVRAERIYLDTSALMALLCPEPDTDWVMGWYRSSVRATLVTTPWTRTELASALSIKLRGKQITPAELPAALLSGKRVLQTTLCEALQTSDFDDAADLCAQAALKLRGPDALHLSAARRLGCTSLATLDKVMGKAAESMGLELVRFREMN